MKNSRVEKACDTQYLPIFVISSAFIAKRSSYFCYSIRNLIHVLPGIHETEEIIRSDESSFTKSSEIDPSQAFQINNPFTRATAK